MPQLTERPGYPNSPFFGEKLPLRIEGTKHDLSVFKHDASICCIVHPDDANVNEVTIHLSNGRTLTATLLFPSRNGSFVALRFMYVDTL